MTVANSVALLIFPTPTAACLGVLFFEPTQSKQVPLLWLCGQERCVPRRSTGGRQGKSPLPSWRAACGSQSTWAEKGGKERERNKNQENLPQRKISL